jgi:serine-type D-Ala-D-Ala carboxypeptidase
MNPNIAKDNSRLLDDWEKQDSVFSSAFSVLEGAIATRAFPAASVAVTHQGRLIALKAFGRFVYETDLVAQPLWRSVRPELALSLPQGGDFDVEVSSSTLFDLASITKVVATTTMAMILYERGLFELDATIIGTIPEFLVDSCGEPDPRRRDVTFRMLLAHSSGLPAYEKLFLKAHTRDDLLRSAFTAPLSADPATRAEYSDIGFIILGAVLERMAEESPDSFCQREVFGPLAMTHTTFNPPAELRPQIPPTADERENFRKRIIQGEVQDENAFVLDGVAGHAGLFSTAEDLARFAHAMLQCGAGALAPEMSELQVPSSASEQRHILRPETMLLFSRRESMPPGTSRALGWDTPSAPSQSGKYFGPNSYGHLGYTGTSLWIDPDRQLSITLLTNRTWPDSANQAIKQVRPAFHDAIIEALK